MADEDNKFCISKNHTCSSIIVYPSNMRKPDFCYKYKTMIDRDRRQRAERTIECLKEFPDVFK